jgi:cobalt-zinc-cadmium efflux system membrane fusion protein
MKITHAIVLMTIFALSLSLACQRKKDSHDHDHAHDNGTHKHAEKAATWFESHDHDNDHDHSNQTTLKDVPGTRTQTVSEPKELAIWLPAEVIADESSQFVLSSPVNGILGTLLVPPGRQVATGVALAEVRSPELARLHADWLSAKARLLRAETTLAREERLDAKKATSQRDLEEAVSEASIAKAEEESARLALESLGITAEHGGAKWTLKAPRAGAVIDYKAISGQGVSAGQDLGFFLADGPVIVRMEIDQTSAGSWKPGQVFQVKHSGGQQWDGRLEGIVPALSSDTLRQTYRVRLSGDSMPLPGTPVEVQIPFPPSITLPQAALQQIDGQWGVFIAHHGYAEFCPVVRGRDIKGEVMILSGIKPGQIVVVEGAYLIKAYQQRLANPEEEGHVH